MTLPWRGLLPRAAGWVGASVIAAAGLLHLGLVCTVFAVRLRYPFDLEWMEGGMLCHALRILEGQPLYGPPSADFIAYLYTPLYPLVLAALGKLVGLSYALGRAVSVLSFIGVLALAVRAVWREVGHRQGVLWGLGAAGLIASTFPHTGAWYDLVRNDSLYLLLITSGLYLLWFHHRRWSCLIASGVLMGLGFLAKQTASPFIIFAGLALLVVNWRRLPVYVAVVGLVAGGTALVLNHVSAGWFWRYTFEMHQGHDLYWDRIWPKTELTLLKFFPAVAAASALTILITVTSSVAERRLRRDDRRLLFWFGLALTGILVSAMGFATQWAVENAYIPGLVFPAIFVAIAGGRLALRWSYGWRQYVGALAALLVGLLLAYQLVGQRYQPARHLPTAHDREAGEALITLLREVPGPVLMPYHPFYPYLAGKRPSYPQMGINDVTRARYPFPADIQQRIMQRYYSAIVLDNPPGDRYGFLLGPYKLARYFQSNEVPRVITGYSVRPTYLFVRKEPDALPPGARRLFDFETGGFSQWYVQGVAFGSAPVGGPVGDQGPVGPFQGELLVSSFHGGDGSQGLLRSPPFVVDRPWLSYRIGGGQRAGELGVRLLVDGEVAYSATGPGNDIMEQRRVDVSAYRGRSMQLELVDWSSAPWGHLLFDDVVLSER